MSKTHRSAEDIAAHRRAFIDGLLELAAFYDAHPDLPVPPVPYMHHCLNFEDDPASVLARMTELLGGTTEAHPHAGALQHATAVRMGSVELSVYWIEERPGGDAYRDALDARKARLGGVS